mmetsp:Transcript_35638/g.79174  ORF Transcript_35638/g.79174 Transcript_35638/m.79174 type:complete len:181 (-) Transcript_35638:2377-2919(-)
MLRRQLSLRLRELIVASFDTEVVGNYSLKGVFPHADAATRRLFQLCQISRTMESRIDPIDEVVLRVHIPLTLYFVVAPILAEERGRLREEAQEATDISQRVKAAVADVLEHQLCREATLSRLAPSCFSHAALLQDFLESLSKQIIGREVGVSDAVRGDVRPDNRDWSLREKCATLLAKYA